MASSPVLAFGELLFDELPDGLRAGGGPFNTAAHLAALGRACALVSAVGDDARGRALRRVARELGVDDRLLQTAYLDTGRVAVAFDDAGEPDYDIVAPVAWDLIRWPDPEARSATGQPVAHEPAALALPTAVAEAPAVVFWLLGVRSEVSRATLARVLAQAPASALRAVDVGFRQNFFDADSVAWVLGEADVAKFNEHELARTAQLLGLAPTPEAVAEAYDLETVVVTRGARGASSHRRGLSFEVVAPDVAAVVDTIGCGDGFLAGYLDARLAGRPEAACLAAGCARGAYVATLAGGLPPHDDFYRRGPM